MPTSRTHRPVQFVVVTATILVALVFAAAGVQKVRKPDPTSTMVGRYIDSPQGVRAIGFMELGMALWLLSFRTPRIANGAAAAALVGFLSLIHI